MARLRLLLAATLLLLQISSVEGLDRLLNKTDCDKQKACWVSEACEIGFKEIKRDPPKEIFYLRQTKPELDKLITKCSKYLIVEPGLEEFTFEIMHSGIKKDKQVKMHFSDTDFGYFTCTDKEVKSGQEKYSAHLEPHPETENYFCRFTVKDKFTRQSKQSFYYLFKNAFPPVRVVLIPQEGTKIEINDYNTEHFQRRVPCSNSIFMEPIPGGKEHIKKPNHHPTTRVYTCDAGYKLFFATKDRAMNVLVPPEQVKCNWGMTHIGLDYSRPENFVTSAKCARPRNALCGDICNEKQITNATCTPDNAEIRSIKCSTTFMVVNGFKITKTAVPCSDRSEPDKHLWKLDGDFEISDVQCLTELDCHNLAPYIMDESCETCTKALYENGRLSCANGSELYRDDMNSKISVTCDKTSGRWEVQSNGKSISIDRNKTKLSCRGKKPPKTEKNAPAAASSKDLMIAGICMGVIILILLIILLIYWCCCRKRREPPKEESCKEPEQPPSAPTTNKTDSSIVEERPPPSAPPPSFTYNEAEPPAPAPYSGKRVQFINVSKEVLREIEPSEGFKEFSARDKTDSERSKASQLSQVGRTTDAGITFTGTRGTEKTNEVSKTMAPGDDSRSDASRGGNSSMGDRSQTGGDEGGTPTIEGAKKGLGKKEGGPRVAFRERVSYETETKTRDKSTGASMHTAPEHQIDSTQPEGSTVDGGGGKNKDEPSRLSADAARKAFGKEQTRTTQNTKETNDDASASTKQDSTVGNRSKETDISRTG